MNKLPAVLLIISILALTSCTLMMETGPSAEKGSAQADIYEVEDSIDEIDDLEQELDLSELDSLEQDLDALNW